MLLRPLFLVLVLVQSLFVFPPAETHAAVELTRAEIRSMPLDQRPNRRGHFYGNTVRRRLHSGR